MISVKRLRGTGFVCSQMNQHNVSDSILGSSLILVPFHVSNPLTNVCLNTFLLWAPEFFGLVACFIFEIRLVFLIEPGLGKK